MPRKMPRKRVDRESNKYLIGVAVLVIVIIFAIVALYQSRVTTELNEPPHSTSSVTTMLASRIDIDADRAFELVNNGYFKLILDVRNPEELQVGWINGSINIPLSELENKIEEILSYRDQPILVYCRSGRRSTSASELLIKYGFTRVYNLRGGINSWIARGYPVVK